MPNIVGLWDTNTSREEMNRLLDKQINRVWPRDMKYKNYKMVFPGLGVALLDHGILENGPQPVTSDDGRFTLILDGEIYNCEEVKHKYRRDLGGDAYRTPQFCLELVSTYGPQISREFSGVFVIVYFDSKDQRLTIIGDRPGCRPLFYLQRQGRFIFGSELKAIAVADTARKKFDDVGMFELLCYGSQFMERTWIEGYTRLPPSSILSVDRKGTTLQSYWEHKYDEQAPKYDQQTYAMRYAVLLDRAVQRCMRGSRRIGIFLSGGYDSRCIAASTRREHRPIPAITFGDPACRDVRFARQLTQELGLDHHVMTSECPYLYDLCPSIVWRTEGMLPFSMTTSPHHHDKIMQLADIILIGVLGDYNGAHTWPSLLLSRSREDTKNAIFSKRVATQIPLLKRVFRDGFFSRAFEALRQRFDQSFETLPNSHPLNVADSWYFMTLASPSAYFSPTVDRHKLETRMPLVDLDLVEFLLTIPPYARLEQRVYKKMIAYTFPCIRNVPCTNSALPVNPNFFDEYSRMIIRRLGRSIDSKIRDTFRMNKEIGRELGDDDQDFRNEPMLVDGYLKSLMRNDVLSSSIFNHDEIDRIIEMHYKKGESNWLIISQLITLGMAIKYILYSDLSDAPQSMYTS